MKLRRPSPALVISCIALVVACTGSAVAATIISNSGQIKNGAVQSGDLKNGTVQGVDIKNGTITANKLKTPPPAGGPTTAYHAVRKTGPEGQPANVNVAIATLTVPAGAYSISASTVMTALPGPQGVLAGLTGEVGAVGGRCRLDAAGDATESLQNVVVNGRGAPGTLFMQNTVTVGGPSDIKLECSAGVPFRLSETSIIANKVSDISLAPVAP